MPRKGHKEGCQCVICRKMDAKAAREGLAPVAAPLVEAPSTAAEPSEVRLGSLPAGSMFELGAAKYRVGENDGTVVVSDQMRWLDDMEFSGWQFMSRIGLGAGTLVKPL